MATEETQLLPTLRELAFQAFLARHSLSLLDVALAAGVRLLTVWRVARDLPVSPQQAICVRSGLARLTGVYYRGGITVNREILSVEEQQKIKEG
jgi:hypothetical protein